MKEHKKDYALIVIASIVRDISAVRINYSMSRPHPLPGWERDYNAIKYEKFKSHEHDINFIELKYIHRWINMPNTMEAFTFPFKH